MFTKGAFGHIQLPVTEGGSYNFSSEIKKKQQQLPTSISLERLIVSPRHFARQLRRLSKKIHIQKLCIFY